MPLYKYEVRGEGRAIAGPNTWLVSGHVTTERQGDFALVPDQAMHAAFTALTEGRAVYGHPGAGCRGPYRIKRLLIEEDEG